MDLVTNTEESNHKSVLIDLIEWADVCLFCTSLFDKKGLDHLLPTLISGTTERGMKVKVFSNGYNGYTKKSVVSELKKIPEIEHVVVKLKGKQRLHSKIYLFEKDKKYSVLIGSANLTDKGLTKNEELSVILHGSVDSEDYIEYKKYFNNISLLATK